MKRTRLKGYIKDFENKNKNFSYIKTMKLLDVINYIFIDNIKFADYNGEYNKSKYIMQEIIYDFDVIVDFLNKGKILLAINILRNTYENILYIIATDYDKSLNVNVKSNPSDFRDIVKNNCGDILSDYFEAEDINELYNYLSKLSHVTNLKEAASYLLNKKNYQKYISNEIKTLVLTIEYMYLCFLNKKCSLKNFDFLYNSIMIVNYINQINLLYYVANTEKENKVLNDYFYGEKNQNYLDKIQKQLLNTFNDYKIYKDDIEITMKKIIKNFNAQIKELNYLEIVNSIIDS